MVVPRGPSADADSGPGDSRKDESTEYWLRHVETFGGDSPVLVVLNKQAGIVVHPARGNRDNTLVNGLLYHCRSLPLRKDSLVRPGVVHRLDKNTTGLLMFAKTDEALANLGRLDAAIEAYDRALELQPGMADAENNRAVVEQLKQQQEQEQQGDQGESGEEQSDEEADGEQSDSSEGEQGEDGEAAEEEAIRVFGANLKDLLLAAPARVAALRLLPVSRAWLEERAAAE